MADSGLGDVKNLLGDVLNKLASLETKLTAVDGELSTVKLDQRRLHDAVQDQDEKQQAAFPGILELRLPEYDGTDDPDIWLHRCVLFFRLQWTEEEKKVCLAAFHMTGKAQIWYYGHERNNGVPTWPQFAESVRRRFAPRRQPFSELIQLRQTGSVAEYREEFLGLVDRCDGVHETVQLAFFTAGLRDPLRADVEVRQPATLQDAAWMAGLLEHREELGFEK